MSISERVTVREYPTTEEAQAALDLLLESGLTSDIASRSGKRIRVVARWEDEARSILEGATPGVTTSGTTTGATSSATDTATNIASSAASTVQGAASSVADTASSAASTAADTVQSAASTVTDTVQQAASTVADTASQAASKVADAPVVAPVIGQVDRATNAAAERLHGAASTLRQQGASPDAPQVQQQVATTAASALDKTAQYIEQPSLTTILEDLRSAVRRSPGRSLLIGFGVGYLARATFLSGLFSQGQQASQQTSQTTTPAPTPPPTAATITTDSVTTGAAATPATTTDTVDYATAYDLDLAPDVATTTATDFLPTDTVVSTDTLTDDTLLTTDASTLPTDPVADVAIEESVATGTDQLPTGDAFVVEVDPTTGQTTDMTSAPVDEFGLPTEGTTGGDTTGGTRTSS